MTAASVVTKASIVASSGAIIPAALREGGDASPRPRRRRSVRLASFTRVSVVITASAASSMAPPRAAASWGAAATSFVHGQRHADDAGGGREHRCRRGRRARAPRPRTPRARRARPSGPARAFALPLLATIARSPVARAGDAAASRTGAARAAFTVKQPAGGAGHVAEDERQILARGLDAAVDARRR